MKNARMNAANTMVLSLALCLAMGAARAHGEGTLRDDGYRKAERGAAEAAKAALATAPIAENAPVAILPIHGDDDGRVAELLKIALTDAGKTCVQTEGDPMWDEVLKMLEWHERKMDRLDPATVDLISRKTLNAAKVLLTGTIEPMESRKGRPLAELRLHATEVATALHIWGKVVISGATGSNDGLHQTWIVAETPVPLRVKVETTAQAGASMEADLIDTWARGRLADLGCQVSTGKAEDLRLSLDMQSELFDRTGNNLVYNGTLKATLAVAGTEARELGARSFAAQGTRGFGEMEARRNLADALEAPLGDWLKSRVTEDAVAFASVRAELEFAESIETRDDYAAIENIRKALSELPGVRRAAVEKQDDRAGRVTFAVTYEREALPGGVWNPLWAAHPELLDYLK